MPRNKNTLPGTIFAILVIGGYAIYAYEQAQSEPPVAQPRGHTEGPRLPGTVPQRADAKCKMRGLLPDPVCTPGVADPRVTQKNIYQTICAPNYTDKVRPPTSYTNRLKRIQMKEYGFLDDIREHEEDHLISLQLGGSPDDPRNLWPEPGATPNQKDDIERKLRRAICNRVISLEAAQVKISTDWTTAANGF